MEEILRTAIFMARGMWQRRWLGLAVVWIVGIAAAIGVMRIPDRYDASARIFVDTQSLLKPLMSGLTIQPRIDEQVRMLSRTLISRPNIEKLIRMSDLDLNVTSKEDQDRTVEELMRTVSIRGTGRDNLYVLSFRNEDPEKARRVIQSLVTIFVESGLGGKRKDADSARKFIDEQIRTYEKKLEDAEARVKEFKLANMALADQSGGDYYGKLGTVATTLQQAKLELAEAENARDSLKRQISGEEPVFLADAPPPTSVAQAKAREVDPRLEALQRQLDTLRLRFTDEHPDIISIKRVMQEIEEQHRAEAKAQPAPAPAAPAGPTPQMAVNANPVYQQLKVSYAEAEARVASLQARVAEYDSRYKVLREKAKMAPEIEAQYAQLNRDYAIFKKNYEALVARRESAELSGEMEAAGGVDFRLIDPPRVSPRPVAPNRVALLALALVGAIGAGLAVSFLASQVWPTFFDTRALREATGLPVLGTVSYIIGDAVRRKERRRLAMFVGTCVLFVGCYGAGLLLLFLQTTAA